MKTLLFGLITFATVGFSHEKEIPLSDVGAAFQAMSDATSFVVKVNPGDTLPLNFHLSGDILGFENPPQGGAIKALQPLYVKIEPNFLFSTDKNEWKTFESFFTGQLGAAIGENGEVSLNLQRRI